MQITDIEIPDEVSEVVEQGGCIGGDEGLDTCTGGDEGLDMWSGDKFAGAEDVWSNLDCGVDKTGETVTDMWSLLDAGIDTTDLQPKDQTGIEMIDKGERNDVMELMEDVATYDDSAPGDVYIDTVSDDGETEAQDMGMTDEGAVPPCPDDMVLVQLQTGWKFCIDRFEASRSDATETSKGISPIPASKQGVLPWYPVDFQTAKTACESVSKRLCRPEEWFEACSGPDHTVYSYGNNYSATICNGIDAFCYCDPYPHCYPVCGAYFHVVPTGTFPDCTNEWGVYDINGNVWEIVDYGDGLEHFRGGAYNCGDSEALHRCDYDATWNPSAKGFRCCKDVQ
jgi:hypothetical protein